MNSTYIDFATPVVETQLTTTQSVSLVNCLGSDTCFAVKFDSSKYYSYTRNDFSGASNGQTICNKTACEIQSCNNIINHSITGLCIKYYNWYLKPYNLLFTVYKTADNVEVNVVMLIDRDVSYEFKVCTNTSATGWSYFTQAVPFTISSNAVTARNFSTFEKIFSI